MQGFIQQQAYRGSSSQWLLFTVHSHKVPCWSNYELFDLKIFPVMSYRELCIAWSQYPYMWGPWLLIPFKMTWSITGGDSLKVSCSGRSYPFDLGLGRLNGKEEVFQTWSFWSSNLWFFLGVLSVMVFITSTPQTTENCNTAHTYHAQIRHGYRKRTAWIWQGLGWILHIKCEISNMIRHGTLPILKHCLFWTIQNKIKWYIAYFEASGYHGLPNV